MKKTIFRGVATALITPFNDGDIDYAALRHIIEDQISAGIDCLVIAGTTAEAATLSESERIALFEFTKEQVSGRVPLIFGVGTNDTRTTVRYAKAAERIGADGLLVVTPYYNKGTDSGIISHYLSVAEATELPIVLYNVPKRTGVDLKISAIRELGKCERIVALKEASDSVDRLTALAALSDSITLYSGNDSQVYACLSLGGGGVISVLSNLFPREMKAITDSFFSGERDKALAIQHRLLPMINAIFAETNPSPIKYAMHITGHCLPEVRLPLSEPKEETKALILKEIKKVIDQL